ncbi:hypothetical protein KEM55_002252 [Ascosphaera atra]|nr:hypothetical protein KEM55_002252 [Ascosphaera atra]
MDSKFEVGEPISPDLYIQLMELMFEWAESYDSKDWKRLSNIVAPYVNLKYIGVSDIPEFNDGYLPKETFLSLASWPGFLGDDLIGTQHLIGLSKFRKISSTEVIGCHQIRAAHQRFKDDTKTEIARRGHGHAVIRIIYRKVGGGIWPWSPAGQWKWAGIETNIRWNEGSFEDIFQFEKNGSFEDWVKSRRQATEKVRSR